jgi:hypothetical protein
MNATRIFQILAPVVITNYIIFCIMHIFNGNDLSGAIVKTLFGEDEQKKWNGDDLIGAGILLHIYHIFQVVLVIWLFNISYFSQIESPILGVLSSTNNRINSLSNFFLGMILPIIYISGIDFTNIYGIKEDWVIVYAVIYVFTLLCCIELSALTPD